FLRRQARFPEPQARNLVLEVPLLLERRAQRRIRHRRDLGRLRSIRLEKQRAGQSRAAILERRVLALDVSFPFVRPMGFGPRALECFLNRDAAVTVAVRALAGERLDEKGREARLVSL